MMTRRKTVKEEYFDWLWRLIKEKQRPTYKKLCEELHRKKFRWSVKNDDNRYEDGLNLRQEYIEQACLDETHLEVQGFKKGDCTVFEAFVALSQRISDYMYDLNDPEDETSRWFMEILQNLNLIRFSDQEARFNRFDPVDEAEIDGILETLLGRTYDEYGNGSLFPMKKRPPKDMAGVEIWYQLMLYLDENYGY